jgi:hypothetical protein
MGIFGKVCFSYTPCSALVYIAAAAGLQGFTIKVTDFRCASILTEFRFIVTGAGPLLFICQEETPGEIAAGKKACC